MLRVECESCKSPYQVDERRVPAHGLKMRCPKCGNTFVVNAPGAAAASPAPPVAEKKAPAVPPANPLKRTMVGLGDADLPAARQAPPLAPKPKQAPSDLPAARHAPPIAPKLPEKAPAPPPPKEDSDLPAARPAPPLAPRPFAPSAPKPAAPAAPRPAPAAPKAAPPAPKAAAAPVAPKPAPLPPKVAPAVAKAPVSMTETDPFADAPVPDLPTPARREAGKPVLPKKPAPEPMIEIDKPTSGLPPALGSLDDSFDLPTAKAAVLAPRAPASPPAAKADDAEEMEGFGELDLPMAAAGLPMPAASLPVSKGRAAKAPPAVDFEMDLPLGTEAKPAVPSFDLDLPVAASVGLPSPAAALPARTAAPELAFGEVDLPSIGTDLPTHAEAGLPAVGAALPSKAEVLPATANVMPAPAASLPMTADVYPRAANVLPVTANTLPQTANVLPSRAATELSDFGELDLPPSSSGAPPMNDDLSFGELDLPPGAISSSPPIMGFDERPPSARPVPMPSPPPHAAAPPLPSDRQDKQVGGMAFGEVDLGGGSDEPAEAAIPAAPTSARELSLPQEMPRISGPPPGEVALPTQPQTVAKPKREVAPRKPSVAKRVVLVVLGLALVGGAALELTPYGAFGRFAIMDQLHAQDYAAAMSSAGTAARAKTGKDTFVDARGAVDDAFAAHSRAPRAKVLAAYAAFVEGSYEARFGADADRSTRAKQLLAELAANPETKYYALAGAAQDAAQGSVEKARKALDAASKRDASDPIQEEIALLRGEVELRARDPVAAKAAFSQALKANPSARAHFGLARAARMAGDDETLGKEIEATLAATPNHPGALVMRAEHKLESGDEVGALADFAVLSDGPAKALAAPREIADALADTGFIHMRRGRAADARVAFESALKTVPTDVGALIGQGQMLSSEGRYTEALTRFDTAIQNDPSDTRAIAYDALTKVRLERLKDAKDQLVVAIASYPKAMLLQYALSDAERALGNRAEAEKALRAAIDLAKPSDPDAVLPYVALATMLASQEHADDAKGVVKDASAKLPDTPALERALGEFLAAEGQYDDAVARYKRAIEIDPQDLATRFKLGVTYRRMRKMDEAGAQFDQVLAIDPEYPGLALERGLLFEESGDTAKALEQFKNALAKAPDDPDLMMRVGAAYVAIDRPDDALPMLRKVLEKRANSAEANHYLGRALFAKGGSSANEAMRYLKRATELDPNRAEYHLYVAWAANESNSREALGLARDEVDKAFALDKLNGDVFWQRGVLERKQGAVEDALRDLKRALELKPSRIDAHAAMAECYEDKNDPQTALLEWQRAVAGDDKKPTWRYRYGKLLLLAGSAGESAKHLSFAASAAEGMEIRPGWYADVEFQAAEAYRRNGQHKEAIEKYKKFLEVAPTSSPDRRDAITALSQLGAPYAPGP